MKVKVRVGFKAVSHGGWDYGHKLYAVCWYKTSKMLLPVRRTVLIYRSAGTYDAFTEHANSLLKNKEEVRMKIVRNLTNLFTEKSKKNSFKDLLKEKMTIEFEIK